jgi:hypothetical protein
MTDTHSEPALVAEIRKIGERPDVGPLGVARIACALADTKVEGDEGGADWCPPDLTPNWTALQDWLCEDRDCRTVEIDVRADDPEYPDAYDDETVWMFTYAVTASEIGVYGGEDVDAAGGESSVGGAMTTWVHHGFGDSLDQAAAVCLAMMAEHEKVRKL